MPARIKINNLNRKRSIKKKKVEKGALKVLRRFKKNSAVLDLTFVNDRKIRSLNKRYLGRDRATDVISFTLGVKGKNGFIGDIYISSDTAYKNARRFGTKFHDEILLYVIHGVLHFVGFPDKTVKEKKRMRKLEKEILTTLKER